MFPRLAPLAASHDALVQLGRTMTEPVDLVDAARGDNRSIPGGYTYLGQFIDHDITFDTTPLPERAVDPSALRNFRTPKLDLDSVYGLGPAAQPYLYERTRSGVDRVRFVIGRNAPSSDEKNQALADLPNDLPRSGRGDALIGDPRNDENLIVAQLHLAFLKFHNRVADLNPGMGFAEIRQIVTWHYQWIVLNDFLPRIVHPDELKRVLADGPTYFEFANEPFMPIEFSAAAYRLHTMIRESYDYNRVFGPRAPQRPATLDLMFQFTGFSGTGGSVPVPSAWVIDWRRFFAFDGEPAPANLSRLFDAKLTPALNRLGGDSDDLQRLAVRNLLRGAALGLPSGQDVAAALDLADRTLYPEAIANTGDDGKAAAESGLHRQTPLWYYLMKEAEIIGEGQRLGPVGSRIVAEVIVGLLKGDQGSFLAAHPTFRPELPAATPGTFNMTDLLNLVGEVNPLQ
jgi:hypothetical protein